MQDDKTKIKIKIKIYVVCHDQDSEGQAKAMIASCRAPDVFSVCRVGVSKYFETQVYDYMSERKHEWDMCDFVGVITYQFEGKTHMPLDSMLQEVSAAGQDGFDAATFLHMRFVRVRANKDVPFVEGCGLQHGPFLFAVITKLLENEGFTERQVLDKKIKGCYCNYWVAKPSIMARYIQFYKKTKQALETDHDLGEWINEESYYRGKLLGTPELLRMTGRPYYTLHPFMYERILGFWLHLNKINTKAIGQDQVYGCLD